MLTTVSLSEYGCNTNERKFEEVASLYGDKMTSVYSGGLVYEYSEEGSKYGLVQISGGSVKELSDFSALKTALAGTKSPSGDGGYQSSGSASQCPDKSSTWNVTISSDQLPAIPDGVTDYFSKGAGDGPGLKGAGSQTSGTKSTNLASAADGSVTTGAAANAQGSKGAASSMHAPDFSTAPLVCGLVVLVSTLFGASLI